MKKFYFTLLTFLLIIMFITYYFIFFKKEDKIELVDNEPICLENCRIGDKVVLKDNSSWHVIGKNQEKIILFSDSTIDLEGEYIPVNTFSMRNTGQPVAFDTSNNRSEENNPYCIFPDLGCSVYEKNDIDVFEDSSIKKLIDTKFVPKITTTLNNNNIIVRLLKKEEFDYFKKLEVINNTSYKWLYYSGYWLMDAYNQYSVYAIKQESYTLTRLAPYIHYQFGVRPVIEIPINLLNL